jgi:CheY-like chemotaxis protein
VVDDNRINLKVAIAYLAKHNIRADRAADGYEAIRMIRQKQYDLIFMDHMMPDMDGVEAARRIRAMDDGKYADIPIIALSANAVAGARETFRRAGMNDFLPKPIDPRVLNMMLLKWLPPEKVSAEKRSGDEATPSLPESQAERPAVIDEDAGLKNAAGDEAFYRRLLANFAEDHAFDSRRIDEAMQTGEAAVAKRVAHTLKSTAALIGAKDLEAAAFAVERNISREKARIADDRRQALKAALDAVVAEIEAKLAADALPEAEADASQEEARAADGRAETDGARAADLIERLTPLLRSGSTDALRMIDEIRELFAPFGGRCGTLIDQIEAFDFDDASKTLRSLRAALRPEH